MKTAKLDGATLDGSTKVEKWTWEYLDDEEVYVRSKRIYDTRKEANAAMKRWGKEHRIELHD